MNKEYTIKGLTKPQVTLLDTMWAIDGFAEYMEWKSNLDAKTLRMVETFEELLMLQDIDEVDDLTESKNVIKGFLLK
jgi:hypothetical protein